MSDFTVVVATYGDRSWAELGERAATSAESQAPVIHIHGDNLHQARNDGLAAVNTEYTIFLDGDDELEPGYVEAMAQGTADVRAPLVQLCRDGIAVRKMFMPKVHGHQHVCTPDCLLEGGWIVIGGAARTELLRSVGGFDDYPIYEDWALWLKCYRAGATFEAITGAVYRQHLRRDSRNHAGVAWQGRHYWHQRILTDVLGETVTT